MVLRTLCLMLIAFVAVTFPAADPLPPRLMLASDYPAHGAHRLSEYWVSEKLDGVRGRWDGTRLRTRAGHPVDPPDWFTAGWPAIALDGELWIGRGRFDEVSGIVRALVAEEAAWRNVRFMVFDLPDDPGNFDARLARLRALLVESDVAWLQPVRQFRVKDADALDRRLRAVVSLGGEGLMLHHEAAHYRSGRSADLLKFKPYSDAEARVVGYTDGRGKYRGRVGALIVERPDGLRFRLGSGLTDADREAPPALGSRVTYRFNGVTVNGIPRFARFVRVRPEERAPAD